MGMCCAPFLPKPPEATRSHLKPPEATRHSYTYMATLRKRWRWQRGASWNSMHSSTHRCRRRAPHPLVRAPQACWPRFSPARWISRAARQANANDHIWSTVLRVINPRVRMSTPRLELGQINPMSKISAICGINFSTARSQWYQHGNANALTQSLLVLHHHLHRRLRLHPRLRLHRHLQPRPHMHLHPHPHQRPRPSRQERKGGILRMRMHVPRISLRRLCGLQSLGVTIAVTCGTTVACVTTGCGAIS